MEKETVYSVFSRPVCPLDLFTAVTNFGELTEIFTHPNFSSRFSTFDREFMVDLFVSNWHPISFFLQKF